MVYGLLRHGGVIAAAAASSAAVSDEAARHVVRCGPAPHFVTQTGGRYYRSIYYRAPQQVASRGGHFPAVFKEAFIKPIVKRSGLDDTDVSFYRQISNLTVFPNSWNASLNAS